MSRTEQLFKDIRKMPLFQQLIPMEAGVGWPIPQRRNGKLYIKLPFFGQTPTQEKGKIALLPPFSTITISWSNFIPVEYIDLRYSNPAPELNWQEQVGIFPHRGVQQMTVETYKQKRRDLLAMYDDLFNTLADGGSRTTEQDAEFSQLFSLLIEPPLIPYYRVLGKKFCDRFLIA
jgi:hypothetical protein